MQTTTATYVINVTTEDENVITFYKTLPTRPKTSKGRKSQNDPLCKWVEKEYPDFTSYEILPLSK
jgi:hypothetical protein